MPHNILKVILDGIIKHHNNQLIILYNILANLILKSHYINNQTFSLELYEKIYNKEDKYSFINIIKNKYNFDVLILDINDVEKRLEELIGEYISDTQDIAGEDLDFGAGEFGYKDDKALFKDFILYILRRYDINLN